VRLIQTVVAESLFVDVEIGDASPQFVLATSTFLFNYNTVGLSTPTKVTANDGPWDNADADYLNVALSSGVGYAGLTVEFAGGDDNNGALVPGALTYQRVGTVRLRIIDAGQGSGLAWRQIGTTTQVFKLANPGVTPDQSDITNVNNFVPPDNFPLPVELTSFTALVTGTKAVLSWKTATEKNNYGFQVQRGYEGQQSYGDVENGFVAGHGTTNVPQSYSFTDQNAAGGPWSYRLKQMDLDGTVAYYYPNGSNGTATAVKVEEKPRQYSLGQNYPNPFNPATRIRYALPADTHVRLEVFNVIGQKVATLVDAPQPAGYYDRTFDARGLPSGLYFYRLVTPEVNFLKKMMVLK
jgi:hypothetical protein